MVAVYWHDKQSRSVWARVHSEQEGRAKAGRGWRFIGTQLLRPNRSVHNDLPLPKKRQAW